jgi:hypothetical protein
MGTPAVTYKIGGKYDKSGETNAVKGIASLTNAAKTFNTAMKAFVGVKVLQGLHSVIDGSTEAFYEQKDAQSLLFTSISRNANLSKSAFSNLKKQADELTGIFDGSAIESQQAYAAQIGLTQKQIEDTTSAAVDMASSGIKPLDNITKMLTESYSGNVSELKKIVPEVSKLTTEQLKHGDAVKLVAQQYKGYAAAMGQTFSGRDKVFKNTFGDLQAAVGSVWGSLKFEGMGKLLEPIKKLTNFIEQHQTQIINAVLHLPEIFGTVFSSIGQVIKKTFSADGLKNLFVYLGSTVFGIFRLVISSIWDLIKLQAQNFYQLADVTIGNIGRIISNGAANIGNLIIEALNKVLQVPGIKQLYEAFTGNKSGTGITFRFQQQDIKTFSQFAADVGENFKNFDGNLKTAISNFVDGQKLNNTNFLDDYKDISDEARDKISKILNSDLPADLKKALAGNVVSGGTAAGGTSAGESTISQLMTGITSNLGNFGTTAQTAYKTVTGGLTKTAGLIGLIISLISSAISVMSSKSEYFSQSISFDTIFKRAFSTSKIDEVAKPLVNVLKDLGTFLKPIFSMLLSIMADVLNPISKSFSGILQAFTPLISAIAKIISLLSKTSVLSIVINLVMKIIQIFTRLSPILNIFTAVLNLIANILMWLYNKIVVPVYNGIVWVFTQIANFFIGLYNRIADVLNSINIMGWQPFDISKKDSIDYDAEKLSEMSDDDYNSNSSDDDDDSSSGGSASYTAAKDVYVNIYFNNSYVNGDAQQIAIMLAKEIKNAEKLGYVA